MTDIFKHTDIDGDRIKVAPLARSSILAFRIDGAETSSIAHVSLEGARELRDALDKHIEAHEPRVYVVGLPVTVTVHKDGRVEYEVDTSEAAEAVESEWEANADSSVVTFSMLRDDMSAIRLDNAQRNGL